MKKRFLVLLLAAVLLITAVPLSAQATSDICFVAVNDTLPESISFAYVKDAVTYVPCAALGSFRIYNLYDSNISTVLIYTSSQQVTIDMKQGIATDKDGVEYSATAIYRNGQVYVPAQFICSMFGLNASYIEGVGYGDICRITDGTEVLGDTLFLSAATNQMRTRYQAYQDSIASTPAPSHSPAPEEPEPHDDVTIYLSFLGSPTGYLLNLLKNYDISAAFFLTGEDILTHPDIVRRIVGEGHMVGIYCADGSLQSLTTASDLLFEAAHVRTVLVTAGENTSPQFLQRCQETGLVPVQYDINAILGGNGISNAAAVTGKLGSAADDTVLMMALTTSNDPAARAAVYHIYSNHYRFGLLRETGYTGGEHRVK